MFDINNDKERENQKRFIEILLIIGGLIGGSQIKESVSMNPDLNNIIYGAWGSFLIGSLYYYVTISKLQPIHPFFFAMFYISIFSVSFGFTVLGLLPFMNAQTIPTSNGMLYGMGVVIFSIISLGLYGGREKK